MKFFSLMMLTIAALLLPNAAMAHGDEKHEETPAQTAAAGQATASRTANESPSADHGDSATTSEHDRGHESAGLVGVLKKLHPATVHFPIALFLMAALTELFVMSRRTTDREAAVRIMIYGGAAGALLAVLFGWIHTGLWWGGDTVMQLHRWNGMLLAALGLAAAGIAHRQPVSRGTLRSVLAALAILIIVQGYMGGELAHGPDHLGL